MTRLLRRRRHTLPQPTPVTYAPGECACLIPGCTIPAPYTPYAAALCVHHSPLAHGRVVAS